eukprot:scaffold186353_cov42-Prasinocladus_malaysianus.AAC.1
MKKEKIGHQERPAVSCLILSISLPACLVANTQSLCLYAYNQLEYRSIKCTAWRELRSEAEKYQIKQFSN